MIKNNTDILYHYYYYTSNAEFRLNVKTFLLYGLTISLCLIVLSLDSYFSNGMYFELIVSSFVLLVIVIMIRRLKQE